MGTVLLAIYVVVLLIQIVFLFRNLKKPLQARWKRLYITELGSLIAAVIIAIYYNSLPASGFLGMTYLAEILFSAVAALLFAAMLILSFLLFLISRWKHKNRQKNAEA